ncbi:phage major capsid protein, P2 family [Lysobacter capsici]|uniref:phage major capsid protein, P2 family n=1 Tax=Lysobacter capsici TaxID=435897 RepID=UPI0017864C81|nr:phage major capsid protein, P2 family [Lysobacter capsici]UOF16470.1 phage major capsid protein, P2 family [Lysobacter capsici]
MRPLTRRQFNAYNAQVAQLNEVESTAVTFAVAPTVQQKLENRIQESSEFLSKINVVGVDELQGEKVALGVSGTVAGRTDTSAGQKRQPRNVAAVDGTGYQAVQTDFDTAIKYATLDAWAKFPDFQARLRDAIVQRQALDRLMIGFNGTSVAPTTNRATNPLLQDVNKGWLQQYRDHANARVLASGKTAGKVVIGSSVNADYKNLDALVYDAVSALIDPWHQKNPALIVVLGRELVHDKYFPMVNKDQPATEKLATDIILSQKRAGGLPLAEVPYIPDGTLLITTLKNLSLYWQINGRRRYMKEEPELNQIANYESSNDAYVVEDFGLGCVVEHIEIEA